MYQKDIIKKDGFTKIKDSSFNDIPLMYLCVFLNQNIFYLIVYET
ncbi:hypothetical protein GGR21_002075 [Dysgonomonas hofstadii]|uniref:Uncharacterized protein n=1 Tax=Dysgonomonas hofstadii TaxID=637886 RepID=A0A840CRE3_9BACT|nr:hypothetical protein [Dysgonomonas hofstadii]